MKNKKFIVAIIPARGGSKGLPKKNIAFINGKPLIAHTIEAAKKCNLIDKVVVSTDSEEIRKISIKYGADVPFLRSKELSGDDIPCNPVIKDCHERMEFFYKKNIDIVLYMQPTEIFRKMWMIESCIKALVDDDKYDSSFVAYASHKNFWYLNDDIASRVTQFNDDMRQNKIPIYREDTGLACAISREVVKKGFRIGERVKIIPHHDELGAIDIHNKEDLINADILLKRKEITIND
ncbi:acylneuraminate cytidylyltransferase family protein [Pelagibacteraceae bacterium]|nr:acylneuraminate cytidylyltransferase family protein [Pelagibacteraceae bacterium]